MDPWLSVMSLVFWQRKGCQECAHLPLGRSAWQAETRRSRAGGHRRCKRGLQHRATKACGDRQNTNPQLPGRGIVQDFGKVMCTVLYSEWQYFVAHGTHLILCASLDRRGVWGRMDTCICTAKSFCCAPEIITTLLVGYTPIQNKNFEKNKIKGLKKILWRMQKEQGLKCSRSQSVENSPKSYKSYIKPDGACGAFPKSTSIFTWHVTLPKKSCEAEGNTLQWVSKNKTRHFHQPTAGVMAA